MSLWQELRYASRTLKNSPAFAAVAVLTLALGIGANTAMFSVVRGVLLKPLPYPQPQRIVALNTINLQTKRSFPRMTGPDLVDVSHSSQAFEQFSLYYGGELGVQLSDHAEFTGTTFVAPNYFRVFGVAPQAGRVFDANDAGRGAVVSAGFAQRNFGGVAGAIGGTLHVEDVTYEVVGVMPPQFNFPARNDVWVAVSPAVGNTSRTAFNYRAVARLRPGMSVDAANAQLETLAASFRAQYPEDKNRSFQATPLQEELVGSVRSMLYFLMAAVSLVLLIACANVANLMLARASGRSREMAVRAALGASRGAIVRQLLVESALLALAGGASGILLAYAGTGALLTAIGQKSLPNAGDVRVDWAVMLFAIGASLVVSFVFGLSPAWHASRVDVQDALKQAGRGSVSGGPARLRNALVVAQVALSFMLAIGAGLLFRSFMALNSVDMGYRTQGMLVMYAHDPAKSLDDHIAVGRWFQNLFDELQQLPGVTSTAGAMGLPTGQYGSNGGYIIDGQSLDEWMHGRGQSQPAVFSLASPGYFSTLGIPLLRGRDFSKTDLFDSPFVAIISESLARQSFPGQDPFGHRILCGLDSPKWMTIVGVVADVRQESPASKPGATLYMPLQQHPFYGNEVQVILRTAVSPTSLVDTVRNKVRGENPQLAMKFTTVEAMFADSIATPRLRMLLVGLFAGLALLLAMAGMYGVMSYTTTQRIPEFGVRMALGAAPRHVVLLVLRRASQMAALGIAAGLALAFAASRVMSSMLFGLKATDAVTYGGVLLAVMPIILVAAAIPAWRAARVDPVVALRNE